MRLPDPLALLLLLGIIAAVDGRAGSDSPVKPLDEECTITSPHSENFFDLRKLRRSPDLTPPQADWQVKGLDYGANFSINICGPVLADTSAVEGVADDKLALVSAFYEKNGTKYSIGCAPLQKSRRSPVGADFNTAPCRQLRTSAAASWCSSMATARPAPARPNTARARSCP